MRYGVNETQSDILEMLSPKESPDMNKYSKKINIHPDLQSKMQAEEIIQLKIEIKRLQEKINNYEKN